MQSVIQVSINKYAMEEHLFSTWKLEDEFKRESIDSTSLLRNNTSVHNVNQERFLNQLY